MTFAFQVSLERKLAKRGKVDRRVEKAKELGHVAEGKRIKAWHKKEYDENGSWDRSWYYATYLFTTNGKQYKCKYMGKVYPSFVTNVYWKRTPRRAFVANEWRVNIFSNLLRLLWHAIPLAVGVAVINLLGGV